MTMASFERYDLVPAPVKECHVCGWPLHHDMLLMKEYCFNSKCQVYDIHFNILHLPKCRTGEN